MYIDADSIIKAGSVVTALGLLVGLIISIYKQVEQNKRQNKQISAIQKEQTIICYALKGALQGLIESGCNGPCKKALNDLEKHLNKSAHECEEGEGAGQ
jgi:fructose-1,6-bisphosphatase